MRFASMKFLLVRSGLCDFAPLGIAVSGIRGDQMTDPTGGAATSDPEAGCDDQQEDATQKLAVVDLSDSRYDGAQDCGIARLCHFLFLFEFGNVVGWGSVPPVSTILLDRSLNLDAALWLHQSLLRN
jgi:hypothetical protein